MTNRTISLICCILSLALLSCRAQEWEKPGASEKDFEHINAACTRWATAHLPPQMRLVENEDAHTTPPAANCSGAGASIRCAMSGGQSVPPTVTSVDDNKPARDQAIRNCLTQNGWTPVKEK